MQWLIALVLILLSSPVFAQACGPDPAPAQAVSGCPSGSPCYPCETFRWTCGGGGTGCASGSGDTISEIDTAQAYTPGFKLYYGTANKNGHVTVSSDFTVDVNGKIHIQTALHDGGAFVLNTCGGPQSSPVYTVGQFFQAGWYVEFIGEWNATGNPGVQTGFYGLDDNWYAVSCPTGACWEIDNLDAFAFEQRVSYNGGGTTQELQNNPSLLPNRAPTVETGIDKWGVLSTPTVTSWWFNNALNGSPGIVDYTVPPAGGILNVTNFYNSKQCFGFESTVPFPLVVDGVRVWQAGPGPPPAVFGGGTRKLMHRQ